MPILTELTLIWGTQGTQGGQGVVYADYLDWRAQNRTFAEMGVMRVTEREPHRRRHAGPAHRRVRVGELSARDRRTDGAGPRVHRRRDRGGDDNAGRRSSATKRGGRTSAPIPTMLGSHVVVNGTAH